MNNSHKYALALSAALVASCGGGGGGGGGSATASEPPSAPPQPSPSFSVSNLNPVQEFPLFDGSYRVTFDATIDPKSYQLGDVIVRQDGNVVSDVDIEFEWGNMILALPSDIRPYAQLEIDFSGLTAEDGKKLESSVWTIVHYPVADPIEMPNGRLVDFQFSGQDGLVYALTEKEIIGDDEVGIFVSKDYGEIFSLTRKGNFTVSSSPSLVVDPASPERITVNYASIGPSFTYSLDAGDTWVTRSLPSPRESLIRANWNMSAKSLTIGNVEQLWEYDYISDAFKNTIPPSLTKIDVSSELPFSYSTRDEDDNPGIHFSADEGRTLTMQDNIGLPAKSYYYVWPANSNNPAAVFAGVQNQYIEAYYSEDYGNSFAKVMTGPLSTSPSLGGMRRIFIGNQAFMFIAKPLEDSECQSGRALQFMVSNNGLNWVKATRFCAAQPHSIYLAGANRKYLYFSYQDNFYRVPTPASITDFVEQELGGS